MLFVIPAAHSDKAHLASFVANLKAFPPAKGDRALIVPTTDAANDRSLMAHIYQIREVFGQDNSIIQATPNTPEGGWPKAPNYHFMWGVSYVQELEKKEGRGHAFMWLETDVRFLRQGWSESLQVDYRNNGKPFYGVEVPSVIVGYATNDPTKKLFSQQEGVHMMGVGIYPEFYTNGRAGWRHPQEVKSFTIFCQHEHANFARTTLIEHRGRTINWKRKEGAIFTCEDVPGKSEFHIRYGGEVDLSKCVIVHGVKDDSLTEELLRAPISSSPLVPLLREDGDQRAALMQEHILNQDTEINALKLEIAKRDDQIARLEGLLHNASTTNFTPLTETQEDTGILPSAMQLKEAIGSGSMSAEEAMGLFCCTDQEKFLAHLTSIGYSEVDGSLIPTPPANLDIPSLPDKKAAKPPPKKSKVA